jgi:pimeloyl-ACP methyl ester carboxylesterase
VAAVVDAVAARAGGPVALFGHSYGANPAMGGAASTANVSRLVLCVLAGHSHFAFKTDPGPWSPPSPESSSPRRRLRE